MANEQLSFPHTDPGWARHTFPHPMNGPALPLSVCQPCPACPTKRRRSCGNSISNFDQLFPSPLFVTQEYILLFLPAPNSLCSPPHRPSNCRYILYSFPPPPSPLSNWNNPSSSTWERRLSILAVETSAVALWAKSCTSPALR